ncbi:MAG: hypothetical protein U0V54_08680 [Saprospiraceae bacterium]|jgi:FtsH-binding integral membrane protein|nr:hypothetical protein [Saprospiraceae bacterium]
MKPALFYTSLTILLVMQGLGLWWWYHVSPNNVGRELAMVGMGAFVILNIAFYYLASFLSYKSMDQAYLMMTWLNFSLKMIFALGLPAIYYFKDHIGGAAFIVPFLLIYISFTVFETWVLHRMAIMRKV